ncbi:PriCT-2 domain-containing protein [Spirosoma luteum]|uniref:PriCT-2 domain-containing protein n=1 Tax=Spirosoma luteum TaxID=431553 RepID=UPI000378818E|nr:PriCT-2 domain-containing protein [Spirosoma luteum]
MPTYLQTKDVLNVSVSCFANCSSPENPVTINLFTWLKSGKYRDKIEALRQVEEKEKRDSLKRTLPAITPSAVFTYRKESSMVAGSHTRLIHFDIDPKDNPHIRNYADLKTQISKLPFVAYCALSASGKGYWGLVPITSPDRHSQHFDALKRVFAHYGIKIDPAPRNVASARTYSYEPAPHMPEQVMVFDLYDTPPKPKPRPFDVTAEADQERKRVEVCIQEVLRQGTYVGDSYNEWYEVGCSLANGFGESGRDYFHHVSQNHTGYDTGKTDKQFTACLRARSKATLGTFFHLCRQIGIEWKELIPLPVAQPRPTMTRPVSTTPRPPAATTVTTIAEQQARPGSIPKPDESQLERLTVEPCDTDPAECDEPELPGAVPTIRVHSFHEWQCQDPYFSQMGLASLPSYQPTNKAVD